MESELRRRSAAHPVNPLRRFLFGAPTSTEHQEHTRLPKILALPVFASDAISSSVYATQEILLVLSAAGAAALVFTIHLSVAIALLLAIVVLSYSQTVYAYPRGGGSYIVAKDNIGMKLGLIAAASILIDYVLTVATSIASGVQNLVAVPFMHFAKGHESTICVLCILLLVYANLRGLKESGAAFAFPTYLFIFCAFTMIGLGLFGPTLLRLHLHRVPVEPIQAVRGVGLALLLNAFARGCSAMTGTEAISDGVPAFQKPESRNAALTLVAMGVILAGLFVGISVLAVRLGVHYVEGSPPVIDQLNSAVFGKGSPFYYILQGATVAILVLAANTSFADFPRLSSILARDGYMPRQLANLGDKLTFSNGILVLGVFASTLVIAFGGNTDRLIPLYAIGVFIAFTLSQTGMVFRWKRLRGRGWYVKAVINGLGAVATFIVLCTIAYEKVILDFFNLVVHHHSEYGWLIIVLIGVQYGIFRAIEHHYTTLRAALAPDERDVREETHPNTVLVLVPRVHKGILTALRYARGISADVRGFSVEIDPADTPKLKQDWERWSGDIPLVVMSSPYRSVIGPLMTYLDEVERERPGANITVIVPEVVTGVWWHSLLHANYGAWIKLYLLNRRNIVVTNVRYFVNSAPEPESQAGGSENASAQPGDAGALGTRR